MNVFTWHKRTTKKRHSVPVDDDETPSPTCQASIKSDKTTDQGMLGNLTEAIPTPVGDVISRLRQSYSTLRDVVLDAQRYDKEAFRTAKSNVEKTEGHYESRMDLEQLLKDLDTNVETGLSLEQVTEKRLKHGTNILEEQRQDSWLRVFISNFCCGVVLLLLVAAVVSFIFKEYYQAGTIALIVCCNSLLATFMEKSVGNTLSRLASLSAPRCRVIRNDGNVYTLDTVDVVPGDIVMLSTGDVVPADIRCCSLNELYVDEAILTGESHQVQKTMVPLDVDSPFPSNILFTSTNVTNGDAIGVVYATGMNTEVGKIARQLVRGARKKQLSPIQHTLNKLTVVISVISIMVLVLIIIVAIVTGYRDPAHVNTSPFLDIFLVAVGFCVSSIPEGLPMIVTICLSLGCKDIAKKNGSIRKLTAVETLGACSVICSDKTGTLTKGKMTCVRKTLFCRGLNVPLSSSVSSVDSTVLQDSTLSKELSVIPLVTYPTEGFTPRGAFILQEHFGPVVKQKIDACLESHQNLDHNLMPSSVVDCTASSPLPNILSSFALAGFLNCGETVLLYNPILKAWETQGNISEAAIVVASAKCGWSNEESLLAKGDVIDPTYDYLEINDFRVPFSSSRKMKCTVHALKTPNWFHSILLTTPAAGSETSPQFTHVAIVKGAPESLISCSSRSLTVSNQTVHIDWDGGILQDIEKRKMNEVNQEMAKDALRVFALLVIPLQSHVVMTDLKLCKDASQRLELILEQPGVTLLGFYGSLDPPRSQAKDAVKTCHEAGVKVVMITGDQALTASAVASSIGIFDYNPRRADKTIELVVNANHENPNSNHPILTSPKPETDILCSDLHKNKNPFDDYLDHDALDALVDRALVFSRAQPQDKLVIVESLQRLGHIVAMTGDGVNDAPALQSADIGVAMGITGTDVAKGVAELVLLDDNFCTVVEAIAEGRRIYGNIQKFVAFLLATNIGEILYITIAVVARMKMPVESLQILFLNFMSDGCPAVALTREPADKDSMKKPPRDTNGNIMNYEWWLYSNIPHIIFEAFVVIACLVVATYLSTGVFTVKALMNQCHFSNDIQYYCQTSSYLPRFSRSATHGAGFYVSIDYWNPRDNAFHHKPYVLYGRYADHLLSPKDIAGVPDCNGKWCVPSSADQVPQKYIWVNTRQARIATTQSFITAVYCEMFRAYSIRNWDFFLLSFKTNIWMHIACSVSAASTILVTLVPGIRDIFSLYPLALWQYALAIGWALLSLILDEGIPKYLYRRRHPKQSCKA